MAISSLQVVTGYYNSLGTPAINTAVTSQLGAGWIPHGAPVLTDVYGQVAQVMVKSPGLTTTAYSIATGANPMAADATWDALGDPLWIDSTQYLQAYTKGAQVTSLINLTNQVSGILPIANGGTNANNIASARANLQVFLESSSQLSGNLNSYDGTRTGLYRQSITASATPANNYPVAAAGTLLIIANSANGATGCRQFYYPFNSDDAYSRWLNASNDSWSTWSHTSYDKGVVPVTNGGTGATNAAGARENIGLGTTSTPTFGALITDGTTGIYARGRNAVAGSTFVNQFYDSANVLKGQGEFRVDNNGDITIINRGVIGSDNTYYSGFRRNGYFYAPFLETACSNSKPFIIRSDSPCINFQESDRTSDNNWLMLLEGGDLRINKDSVNGSVAYHFRANGKFYSAGGYDVLQGADWNTLNDSTSKAVFVAGNANGPVSGVTYGGIHIGYFNNYASQFAARNGAFAGRCQEAGVWGEWKQFALENNNTVNYAQSGSGTANDIQTTKAVSFINGSTTYNLPVNYGVLAGFGNGIAPGSGGYVGQLCWNKTSGELFTRVRDDGLKVWQSWLKVTTAAVSDERLKDIKGDLNVDDSLDNVNRMEFKSFRYLKDGPERGERRGVIAQQIAEIDSEYTTQVGEYLHLDTHPMLMDALAAIQALTKRDVENKEKIAQLQKDIAELQAVVADILKLHGTPPADL